MYAFERALQVQKEIKALEVELEISEDEKKLNKLADLYHDFEVAGGYEMEYKAAEVLEGLGFQTKDLTRGFTEFSGGWRMRVLLAQMILKNPDILLLDEPTNHLDLPSIEWIEKYLMSYEGSVIIVSHDRYFLDRMVTKVVEISQQTLNHYSGNYSYYETEKEIRTEFQQREFENQQDYIAQQERFIERFKAKASKAKQAQSLVKKLDRMDKIDAPISESAKINFRFQPGITPGKIVTTLLDISKNYGELNILDHTSAEINRGDKIALIGANGKGKSTLLRLIAMTENCGGEVVMGHNAQLSFYAQHQMDDLNANGDILDELKHCGSGKTEPELRELLGCFLFKGDDVYKKIRVLSGGEKARVALAKTIISKANYLLLDEPTNHLDITSVNMLIQALNLFEGTYVLVSHDRYFIQNTANKIWEIIDGKINIFDGTYDEWMLFKKKKEEELKNSKSEIPNSKKDNSNVKEVIPQKTDNRQSTSDNFQSKEEKRLRQKFAKLEEEMNAHNAEKARLEALLADPNTYSNPTIFQKTEADYNSIQYKISAIQPEYETLFEQLMNFES
jgi:ATP-binding cassette subfamily F protein 3